MSRRHPIHQDPDFRSLLLEVSASTSGRISPAFVEKDYWVTRTLSILEASGLEIWFKGGTALAKGFGAIQRFSEDLDLKIQGAVGSPLPDVTSWTSQGKAATESRRGFFIALRDLLLRAGLNPVLTDDLDPTMRAAAIQCPYPGVYLELLQAPFRPFILLEIGNARVTPFIPRIISSFVHDYLDKAGLLAHYEDKRPTVRCVHPLVTLIEKLDAIGRHYERDSGEFNPEKFVRHYDDAAAVADYLEGFQSQSLPQLNDMGTPLELARQMLVSKDIRKIPHPDDEAFQLSSPAKRAALERAHAAIAPMYWGQRVSLADDCDKIRSWIKRHLS